MPRPAAGVVGSDSRSVIVTVTANAAIDRTLTVAELVPGARHRVLEDRAQAGGKGVNVARVLRALGVECRCVVVLGGRAGAWILEDLERSGIPATPVWAPGESRTCLEILERRQGAVTQLHERGVEAGASTSETLIAATGEWLGGAEWLALCGRLASGLPPDAYARLVALAQRRGVRVAVDTSSDALRAAWSRGPDLLRINRHEAEEVLGAEAGCTQTPPAEGPGRVTLGVLSDGPKRVTAWSLDGSRWAVDPPCVRAANPVGCGDAMLAGLLAALTAGADCELALRWATALAAADAESPLAGRPDLRRARSLESQVRVTRLPGG